MEFAEPWHEITSEAERKDLSKELRREVSIWHALAWKRPRAIARRQDRDDVLFELGSDRWAIVHLTWHREWNRRWPATRTFESSEAVAAQLREDHLDFAGHSEY